MPKFLSSAIVTNERENAIRPCLMKKKFFFHVVPFERFCHRPEHGLHRSLTFTPQWVYIAHKLPCDLWAHYSFLIRLLMSSFIAVLSRLEVEISGRDWAFQENCVATRTMRFPKFFGDRSVMAEHTRGGLACVGHRRLGRFIRMGIVESLEKCFKFWLRMSNIIRTQTVCIIYTYLYCNAEV